MSEPAKSLDALVNPAPLTLGQIALLERIQSPLLRGDIACVGDCLAALWLLQLPRKEAAARWHEAREASIAWGDTVTPDEYRTRLDALLGALLAFYDLLPGAAEPSKKNGAGTASSPSSQNGAATNTAGKSTTSSGASRPPESH